MNCPEMQAEFVVGISGDVVELVHRDQTIVERLHPEPVDGEAEGGVSADQNLVGAVQERADRIDLAAVVRAGRVAKIPSRLYMPVRPEAELGQRSSWKLAPIVFSGTTMIACFSPWLACLSSAMNISARLLPEAGGDLMSKILLAAFLVGALLHRPHAEGVGPRR